MPARLPAATRSKPNPTATPPAIPPAVRFSTRSFAQRLEKECGPDPKQRLERAFLLAIGRKPTRAERAAAEEFVQTQLSHYNDKPDKAGRVWTDFCQVVLAGNAFLYVE